MEEEEALLKRITEAVKEVKAVETATTDKEAPVDPRQYFPGETLSDSVSSAFYFYWQRPFLGTYKSRPKRKKGDTIEKSIEADDDASGQDTKEKEIEKEKDVEQPQTKGLTGTYHYITYADVWNRFSFFGSGLKHYGIKEKEFVGMCSKNRVEWILVDYACAMHNMISVPLHTILSQDQVEFILNETEMACVVCSQEQLPKYIKAAPKCKNLRLIVVMPTLEYETELKDEDIVLPEGVALVPFHMIEGAGFSNPEPPVKRAPDDLCTIMYTSGSTGMPKGAMMSDKRFNWFISKSYLMPDPLQLLGYAPLAHVMERQNIYIAMCYGGAIALFDDDMNKLFDHVLLVKPSSFTAVPRVWNQLYSEYQKTLLEAQAAAPHRPKEDVEKEVLEQFSHVLGDKTQYLVTGGAPTSPAVLEFLRKCFPCPVYDGYGTTEVGGIATGNVLSPGVDAKLVDVPELGYTSEDKPYPRGEICVKTPDMIDGYFKNEKATKESFDEEGYFHTGDIGMRTAENTIVIIDRKKNVFKLSQGEFIAPEKLENIFIESKFIDQIYVHGDSLKSYLVAIVVPNEPVLKTWAQQQSQLSDIFKEDESKWLGLLCKNKDVNAKIIEEIKLMSNGKELPPYEIPRAVYLETEKFTAENALLTPSMKLCRGPLYKHYKSIIEDQLYQAVENTQSVLLQVLNDTLEGRANVSQGDDLLDLGVDSISAVRFAAIVKEKFHKEIPMQMLMQPTTLSDLALFIENSSTSAAQTNPAEKDLKDPSLLQLGSALGTPAPTTDKQKLFLTGATGFLGVFLLDELLKDADNVEAVYCLVRAQGEKEGLERLKGWLEKNCLWDAKKWQENEAKIRVVVGDLEKPLLGLSQSKFDELAQEVTAIYHCAAVVNWLYSYAHIREANVIATLDILKLATTHHTKTMHFISTIGVARQSENDAWPMDSLHLLSGYSLSKWVAEYFVQQAGKKGLPVTVFRPGMITGHSKTGASNELDFINRYLRGTIELGNYIEEEGTQDLTPVDYVAKTIIYLSRQNSSLGKTFHLVNPQPISFNQFGQWISSYALKTGKAKAALTPLKYTAWRNNFVEKFQARKQFEEKQKAHEKEKEAEVADCALFGLFPYFSEGYGDYINGTYPQTVFSVDNTLEGLKGSDIACPAITEELIHTYLSSLNQRGLL